MRKTGWIAVAALSGVLAAGCGGDDTDGGTPQAASGGCDRQQDTAASAWRPVALQDDWQPPTDPHAAGETFTLGGWAVTVDGLEHVTAAELDELMASRGGSYDGLDIIKATLTLTYSGEGTSAPDELQTVYVDRDGQVHDDLECEQLGMGHLEVQPGQTVTAYSVVHVPAELVEGGFWGIGLGDTAVEDLTFVR